jgi:hypothetical protein
VTGHIANKNGGFIVRKSGDAEEIATDSSGG